jgi:outer membrane protein TolC
MRAEAIAEGARFEVRQTSRRMESQAILMGRDIGGMFVLPMQVEGDLEQMVPRVKDVTPDYPKLAVQTPNVHKLIKTAESLKAAVVSAQSAVWPKMDGTLDYGYAGNRVTNWRDQMSLGFKVSVPFFSGGQNIEGILKAKADYEAAREAARSVRDDVIAQLADAWVQYVDAVEAVEVSRKFLEASRKRSDIVRAEYTTGLVNFQDFDTSEQDLANSERAYVQSLGDVLVKEANWEFVKGSTLEDALNEG